MKYEGGERGRGEIAPPPKKKLPSKSPAVLGLNMKSGDYCCIIRGISKSGAINLMQNIDLGKKRDIIKHKK